MAGKGARVRAILDNPWYTGYAFFGRSTKHETVLDPDDVAAGHDRCLARTLAPGSPVLADHPKTVNLREDTLLRPLNEWIGTVFDRENRDATVAALVSSQDLPARVSGQRHGTRGSRG